MSKKKLTVEQIELEQLEQAAGGQEDIISRRINEGHLYPEFYNQSHGNRNRPDILPRGLPDTNSDNNC